MAPHINKDFGKNVFINCPFDSAYFPLLRPLLFTIIYLGFKPKIALESSDAGELRIDKICKLIKESQYSIHDLSRLKSKKEGEFYRLNMPFELGIDYGSRRFASNHHKSKKFLILEKKPHDYKKALSDFSGVDIKNHGDKPPDIVRAVRDWFVETVKLKGVKGATVIWYRFSDFATDLYKQRKAEGFSEKDLKMMTIPEYIDAIETWLQTNN
jgi:hypothetical protein